MGLLSNWINRNNVERQGKQARQMVDSQDAILLPRVNASISESTNPDFGDAIPDYVDSSDISNDSPINISVRIYDYQKSASEHPDLVNATKKAYSTYPYIYANDILLVNNEEFTVLRAEHEAESSELVLYLK